MTKLISTLSATVVLLVLGVVSADAGSWSSSWTGPYGGLRTVTGHLRLLWLSILRSGRWARRTAMVELGCRRVWTLSDL